jgi:hypothetical protein
VKVCDQQQVNLFRLNLIKEWQRSHTIVTLLIAALQASVMQ